MKKAENLHIDKLQPQIFGGIFGLKKKKIGPSN